MRWNYYKLRQLSLLESAMDSCYKLRQRFYYKVRHGLLQIATGITKCDDYYKLLTAAQLAQLGERRSAEREVASSNPGRTNTQGLKNN